MKKLLIFAVAALLVYCAGQSVYKTMEAEKERAGSKGGMTAVIPQRQQGRDRQMPGPCFFCIALSCLPKRRAGDEKRTVPEIHRCFLPVPML